MNEHQLLDIPAENIYNPKILPFDESCSDTDSESSDEDLAYTSGQINLLNIIANVEEYANDHFEVERIRTSVLTGRAYVEELLSVRTKESRFHEVFRMSKCVFLQLCDLLEEGGHLRSTIHVSVTEQLAIFLWTVSHNGSNRLVQERFQHSGDTISR